jgi:hypothetical protein
MESSPSLIESTSKKPSAIVNFLRSRKRSTVGNDAFNELSSVSSNNLTIHPDVPSAARNPRLIQDRRSVHGSQRPSTVEAASNLLSGGVGYVVSLQPEQKLTQV